MIFRPVPRRAGAATTSAAGHSITDRLPTAAKTPGDDAAARIVAELSAAHPGKVIIPVWVTECEMIDLPDAKDGTGLCGTVHCAANDCWPRYARNWNPLLKATDGPIALGDWPETFRRDAARWIESDLALFQTPLRGGSPLAAERTTRRHSGMGKNGIGGDRSVRAGQAGGGGVGARPRCDRSILATQSCCDAETTVNGVRLGC